MWYDKEGKDSDVVLYSRVILTRNIKGFPFPSKMSSADKENVIGMVRQASTGGELNFVRVDELDDTAKADIFNQYYSIYEYLNNNDHGAFLLNKNQDLSVLINGSEHISIYSYESGNNMTDAYTRANDVALGYERQMDIAYSEKLGFLTSDTYMVGTGLQIGFLVAIPGIEKTNGALQLLSKRVNKYDWLIETSSYPTNQKEPGIYYIHNISTQGVTEKDILTSAALVINDLVKLERSCRKNIMKKKPLVIEDQYYRSYATLRYARSIESTEALQMLSWLRLGQDAVDSTDANITWQQINKVTHMIRRDYELFPTGDKKLPLKSNKRATKIRAVMKGDEA